MHAYVHFLYQEHDFLSHTTVALTYCQSLAHLTTGTKTLLESLIQHIFYPQLQTSSQTHQSVTTMAQKDEN